LDTKKICIIATQRAPSGNFDISINELDSILKKLFSVTFDCKICGDINKNFLVESDRKRQLETVLKTYNLISVINFPIRIQQNSASIFAKYSITPIINGLSDHDAHIYSISFRSFTK
jgi:hypothetical protein